MTKKIFKKTLNFVFIIFLLLTMSVSLMLYDSYERDGHSNLKEEALWVLSLAAEEKNIESVNSILIIDKTGELIYSNQTQANDSEFKGYPEIEKARIEGEAFSDDRLNHEGFKYKNINYARLYGGDIVRISHTKLTYFGFLLSILPSLLIILVILVLLTWVFSKKLSKEVLFAVNSVDVTLDKPQPLLVGLEPLANKIMMYNDDIKIKQKKLKQETEEFREIIDMLNEGFLILNQDHKVMASNQQARELFNIDDDSLSLTVYNRDPVLLEGLSEVEKLRDFTGIIEIQDKYYRLIMNTINKEKYDGVIIALINVTDQKKYEDLKKEFAANVSHELKTPLTSILGTSEMLLINEIPEDDYQYFVKNIHKEAQNMHQLIDDIIKISKLDEGKVSEQTKLISLSPVIEESFDLLGKQYNLNNFQIEYDFVEVEVLAIDEVLKDVIYNALENAVKYNNHLQKISVTTSIRADVIELSIFNTAKHIVNSERIFERFYREYGQDIEGSGLGLAIIKNGMNLMGHQVEMNNVEEGLELILRFSRENLYNKE